MGDLAMSRATHSTFRTLRFCFPTFLTIAAPGLVREGPSAHLDRCLRHGRVARIPGPVGLDEVQGYLDVLRDPWLGHSFHSEVVLAEGRHPDAVYQAQALKITRILR